MKQVPVRYIYEVSLHPKGDLFSRFLLLLSIGTKPSFLDLKKIECFSVPLEIISNRHHCR